MIVTDKTPPTVRDLENLSVGSCVMQDVTFTSADVAAFGNLVRDHASVHFDPIHAKSMGYPFPIVHGMLLSGRFSRLLGMYLPGPKSVIHSIKMDFIAAVPVSAPVRYNVAVKSVTASIGAVTLDLTARLGDLLVLSGTAICIFPKQPFFQEGAQL